MLQLPQESSVISQLTVVFPVTLQCFPSQLVSNEQHSITTKFIEKYYKQQETPKPPEMRQRKKIEHKNKLTKNKRSSTIGKFPCKTQ